MRQISLRIPAESLLPEEAWTIIFDQREDAERAARRGWIRALCDRHRTYSLPRQPEPSHGSAVAPRRPSSTLSRLNCSGVYPRLLSPDAICLATNLREVLSAVVQAYHRDVPWPKLLDLLATSCAISRKAAAAFLEKVVHFTIGEAEVMSVAQARTFWNHYAAGRARVAALQLAQEVPVWQGDWAHFDDGQLAELLPGLILPDHFRRVEYLTNLISEAGEDALDLFSLSRQPLCRHPFRGPAHQLLPKGRRQTTVVDV